MSYPTQSLPSSLRHPSMGTSQSSAGQPPLLVARINEKRAELENLKQLRDLSAGLAGQMQTLEEKLSTLSDGTEAVAAVLSNWHNILRAINMASMRIPKPEASEVEQISHAGTATGSGVPLPQTLVRVPIVSETLEGEDRVTGKADGGKGNS